MRSAARHPPPAGTREHMLSPQPRSAQVLLFRIMNCHVWGLSLFPWADTQVEAVLCTFASMLQCLQNDSGGRDNKRVIFSCVCVCADARMYV